MLTVCKRAEKKNKAKTRKLSEENFEPKENKMFTYITFNFKIFLSENSESLDEENSELSNEKSSLDEEKDNWKDNDLPAHRSSWLNIGNTPYVKEKLVKILAREVSIPK